LAEWGPWEEDYYQRAGRPRSSDALRVQQPAESRAEAKEEKSLAAYGFRMRHASRSTGSVDTEMETWMWMRTEVGTKTDPILFCFSLVWALWLWLLGFLAFCNFNYNSDRGTGTNNRYKCLFYFALLRFGLFMLAHFSVATTRQNVDDL